MAKKKSYTQGYNTPGYKTLNCSRCEITVHRVAEDATGVVCWKCAMKNYKNNENAN